MPAPGHDLEEAGLMRSLLFVPADSEKKLARGLDSGADALIVDLEDSVSLDAKAKAREMAARFFADNRQRSAPSLYVRVNDLSSGLTDDDLKAVIPSRPVGIMLPKCNGGEDVARLSVKLRVAEAETGLEDGVTRIVPIVTETPLGVLNAASYAQADPRLAGITWGAEDLSAAIGADATRDEDGRLTDVFRLARAMAILAASVADVPAIDTVFPDFRDLDAFRRSCLRGARDGFAACMAIHPAQVAIINEVFTPSPAAVDEARMIVSAFQAQGNPGVVAIGGKMYDRPHLRRAERLLNRAAPHPAK
jgi:citrate lyase subunit beta / citryl-CoA lyase